MAAPWEHREGWPCLWCHGAHGAQPPAASVGIIQPDLLQKPPHSSPCPTRAGVWGSLGEQCPETAPSVQMCPGRCLGLLIPWDRPRCGPRHPHIPDRGTFWGLWSPLVPLWVGIHTGMAKHRVVARRGVPRSLSPSLSHKGSRRFPPFPPSSPSPPSPAPFASSFPAAG